MFFIDACYLSGSERLGMLRTGSAGKDDSKDVLSQKGNSKIIMPVPPTARKLNGGDSRFPEELPCLFATLQLSLRNQANRVESFPSPRLDNCRHICLSSSRALEALSRRGRQKQLRHGASSVWAFHLVEKMLNFRRVDLIFLRSVLYL